MSTLLVDCLSVAPAELSEGATAVVTSSLFRDQLRTVKANKRAYLAAFACSTTPILIGYDLTLIGSIIANTQFVHQFGRYDETQHAWSLSANYHLAWSIVQYVSAMSSALGSGYLNDTLGRRVGFFTTVCLTVCGTFIELFSPDWKVWIVAKEGLDGRWDGVHAGQYSNLCFGDHPNIYPGPGAVTVPILDHHLCQLIATCVLEGTSHVGDAWPWKGAVVSQFGPAALCVGMFVLFVLESPYYLVSKDRMNDARKALARLRAADNIALDEELSHIQETLLHEHCTQQSASSVSLRECFQGTNLRRTMLACLPVVMQILTGYLLCSNYLAYFLSLSGFSNAFLITLISVICSLVAALFAFVLIERVGRRRQMLAGCAGMLVCLLVVSVLGFEGLGQAWNYRALAAFCIIWALFYYASVGAVGWAIVGEMSSARLRAKTTSIAALSSNLSNMVWSIAIPYLVNADEANLGAKAALPFLGAGLVLTAVCFFCLPGTKGLSFARLDALFEARTPARKFV